jgi:hypothetical protein
VRATRPLLLPLTIDLLLGDAWHASYITSKRSLQQATPGDAGGGGRLCELLQGVASAG